MFAGAMAKPNKDVHRAECGVLTSLSEVEFTLKINSLKSQLFAFSTNLPYIIGTRKTKQSYSVDQASPCHVRSYSINF